MGMGNELVKALEKIPLGWKIFLTLKAAVIFLFLVGWTARGLYAEQSALPARIDSLEATQLEHVLTDTRQDSLLAVLRDAQRADSQRIRWIVCVLEKQAEGKDVIGCGSVSY